MSPYYNLLSNIRILFLSFSLPLFLPLLGNLFESFAAWASAPPLNSYAWMALDFCCLVLLDLLKGAHEYIGTATLHCYL